MTFKMPHFTNKNAQTKEEKLILELSKDLIDTMKGFINLNKMTTIDQELFVVLRDGSLAYAAQILEMLGGMLQDKKDIPRFVEEARDIFDCYLKQLQEKFV
jgi:hypothetical protein